MSGHDFGVVELLRTAAPDAVVAAFALLTHLGDTAFIVVALACYYWFGDRRRGASLLGIALGGLALIVALKGLFAFPRPPLEMQAVPADGYGFPSGHALGSTVVWGVFAIELDVGTRRQRTAVAAAAVAVVSLSRVVIGVHYLGDVLAGVVAGLVYLVVATRFARADPRRAFALAGAVAAVALAITVASADAVVAAGSVVGGWAAWTYASPRGEHREGRRRTDHAGGVGILTAAVTLAVLGSLAYLAETVEPPLPALFVVGAVVPAAIVLLPTVRERVVGGRVDATR